MKQLPSYHLVIVAALTILTTDAEVSLVTLGTSQSSFICGEQQTLKCTIDPYKDTMTWKNVNSNDILASCSPRSMTCSVNSKMNTSYSFTFDTDNGIFQMEILKVKVSDNGTTYSCDNGSSNAQLASKVTVEDDYNIIKNDKNIDSNTTEVSVTTGCIKDTADVNFEWWLREVNNNSSEKIKFNESASVTNRDNFACLTDPECGVSGYSFVKNSVNITDDGIGKNYKIGVAVKFRSITNTVWFEDHIFTLNFPVSDISTFNVCNLPIIAAYLIIFVCEMIMCFIGRHLYCSDKQRIENGIICCIPSSVLTIALSLPFIGLFVKGALMINIFRSDHPPKQTCCFLVVIWVVSLACEISIIVIYIRLVVCLFRWFALFVVIPDLIIRLILFIIIFYKDKDENKTFDHVCAYTAGRNPLFKCLFGCCWGNTQNTYEPNEQERELNAAHVSNISKEPRQKVESSEKPVRPLTTGKTQLHKDEVVLKEHPTLAANKEARPLATGRTQIHKDKVVLKEHSILAANNKARPLAKGTTKSHNNEVVLKEHPPLAQNARPLATGSTQLHKNKVVLKEKNPVAAKNEARPLATGRTQIHKDKVVLKEHSTLAANNKARPSAKGTTKSHNNEVVLKELPPLAQNGSHERSKSTMSRGISAVAISDKKDNMAFGTEHLVEGHHKHDGHHNHEGHHNHDMHHDHEVHHNHDEHHNQNDHHKDGHHHL